tara:strand:- start:689 stop:949 length:261 start_codon:yes stop_codon:yes gene_type:complete
VAHFAELDEDTSIKRVIVVHNNELLVDNKESEAKGIEFCKSLYGENTKWVQCSYNSKIRGFYPSAGDFYDKDKDIFIGRNEIINNE